MDFDSTAMPTAPFSVVINITNAVDGFGNEGEGLAFDTSGTDIAVQVSEPSVPDLTTLSYVLEGADTYSVYQSVSTHFYFFDSDFILSLLCIYRCFVKPDTSIT